MTRGMNELPGEQPKSVLKENVKAGSKEIARLVVTVAAAIGAVMATDDGEPHRQPPVPSLESPLAEKGGDPVCECRCDDLGSVRELSDKLEQCRDEKQRLFDSLKQPGTPTTSTIIPIGPIREAPPAPPAEPEPTVTEKPAQRPQAEKFTGMVMYVDDVDALFNGTSSCQWCRLFLRDARQRGYTVGRTPDADFLVGKIQGPDDIYPFFVVFENGIQTFTKQGYNGNFSVILKKHPKLSKGTF